jgi:hypothetical protein
METTLLIKIILQRMHGNEENGYPVPDPQKTMKNDTKELSDVHK